MLGLAIECANRTASAAIWRSPGDHGAVDGALEGSGTCLSLIDIDRLSPGEGKADQLITVIERLLKRQSLGYADLGVIAVNRGPGSFTGIRSAVALGRGLALATGLPVLGVTSHGVLAIRLGEREMGRSLLIALDARRGEVYVQTFGAACRPTSEIEARAPGEVASDLGTGSWDLAGSGAGLVAGSLSSAADARLIETPPIDAADVVMAASWQLSAGEVPVDGSALRPLYVRAPDAVPPAPLISPTAASEVPI